MQKVGKGKTKTKLPPLTSFFLRVGLLMKIAHQVVYTIAAGTILPESVFIVQRI